MEQERKTGRSISPAYNSRILKCNCNFPFNWNVSILVENDYWIRQEAIYTNKPPFTIMYSIFEVYGKGVLL